MKKIEKVSVNCYSSNSKQNVAIAFTKTSDTAYDVEVTNGDNKILTGNINVDEKNENEGTIKVNFDVQGFGKIEISMEYSQKLNEAIDKVEVNESVTTETITTEDKQNLMTNLQKSKLYELIEGFSSSSKVEDDDDDYNTTLNYSTDNETNEDEEDNEYNFNYSYDDSDSDLY